MAVTINGDTGITSVNGTAAAPSITGADTNTGIVYGTDTLSLATGGNTALTINSSQNVSIGISSYASRLASYSGASGDPLTLGYFAASSTATGGGSAGLSIIASSNKMTLQTLGGDSLGFQTNNSSTDAITIDTSGIVTGTAGNLMLVSGTAVAASGTAVDFTGIPSWVKRITVMFSGISTNGTSPYLIQLGDAGGIEITGYVSSGKYFSTTSFSTATSTAGFIVGNTTVAANAYYGHFTLNLVSGNAWTSFGAVGEGSNAVNMGIGGKTLSDTLTQVRITTVGGANTFDLGTFNILYE